MLRLVPPSRSREPLGHAGYSPRVCRAIAKIRHVHAAEEADLDAAERRELGVALRVLTFAALLEEQIAEAETEPGGD